MEIAYLAEDTDGAQVLRALAGHFEAIEVREGDALPIEHELSRIERVGAYVGVMTIPVLNAHGWRGGWSPAARFLVPIAPYLAILAFSAVAHLRRIPVIVFIIVGVQVCLDAFLWQHPGLLWNDGFGTSAFLRFLDGGTGRLSSSFPSLNTPVSGVTMVVVAAASAGWLLLTAWLSRRERDLRLPRPA